MYYEINIAELVKRGEQESYSHLFATAERSITTKLELIKVYSKLKIAFPEPEYNITISECSKVSNRVDPNELKL